MSWITYDAGHGERAGYLRDDHVVGLRPEVQLIDLLRSEPGLHTEGSRLLRDPYETVARDAVRILAPIPRPPSVRDALCFLDHLRNSLRALGRSEELDPVWMKTPGFYFSSPSSIVGPYDDVAISPGSSCFDFELEVGIVIGKGGRDLRPDRALEHVAGLTLFNDWTGRDLQIIDTAFALGMAKSKDSATTLGPTLVTLDDLEPYRDGAHFHIGVSASVNGQEIGSGSLAQIDWTIGELLSYVSRGTDLVPGDVIGTGTLPGATLLEHIGPAGLDGFQNWLKPGDVVALTADVIGETRQKIVPATEIHPLTPRTPKAIA